MKLKEVTQILSTLGWSTHTDEAGDKVAYYHLPDRCVQIIYGVRKHRADQQLEVMPSLSRDDFAKACASIDIGHGNNSPLIVSFKDVCIRVPEILEGHVQQASNEAIAWAQEQDLDAALQEHAALPTNAPGIRPIWHLAALVLLGDIAKLKIYQKTFMSGDRLGFVNYVTEDYIDRAVTLAENNSANS